MKISELNENGTKIKQLEQFARWACDKLGIEDSGNIEYGTDVGAVRERHTFGSTVPDGQIWVHISNRNLADIMRTLCHELVHRKQFEIGTASTDMDEEQRQRIEDEANALAGRMMREYGKKNNSIYESRTHKTGKTFG